MSMIKAIGAALFVIVAFGIVGQMDYEDAVAEEQRYCDMVREGHWPHYNKDIDCKPAEKKQVPRGIKW